MIVAAVVVLGTIAVLSIMYLRGRSKCSSQKVVADRANPSKLDTTLGEFHDMREALRPLQHTRAASRRVPANKKWRS